MVILSKFLSTIYEIYFVMLEFSRCGLANKAFTLFSGLIRDDTLYLPHDRSSIGSIDQLVAYFVENGIQPNRYTFNIILKGLRNDPKAPLEQCFLLLNIMQRRGFSPDAVTINTLIDACSVAGDFPRAQQVTVIIAFCFAYTVFFNKTMSTLL